MIAPEPLMPTCDECGNTKGPWRPDPSGIRYLSGAQVLVCTVPCTSAPEPLTPADDPARWPADVHEAYRNTLAGLLSGGQS